MTLESEHQKNIDRGLTFGLEDTGKSQALLQNISAHTCLFCCQEESHNRNEGSEYICGGCVDRLLNSDQDNLKREHKLATNNSYDRQARALDYFIIPEVLNEQRKPKSKFRININRKRSVRSVRDKKDRVRLSTA